MAVIITKSAFTLREANVRVEVTRDEKDVETARYFIASGIAIKTDEGDFAKSEEMEATGDLLAATETFWAALVTVVEGKEGVPKQDEITEISVDVIEVA